MGPILPMCTPVDPARSRRIGPIDCPQAVYKLLSPKSLRLERERAWMLLLTRDKMLAVESEIGRGTEDEVEVDLEWALACARRPDTPYCVLVHNHPSGSAWPSWQDGELTADMGASAWSQGVELLDHVILGRGEFYSFHHEAGTRI